MTEKTGYNWLDQVWLGLAYSQFGVSTSHAVTVYEKSSGFLEQILGAN